MRSRPGPTRTSDAPTEPLPPGTVVTEEYDVAQEPVAPVPPEPPPPVRRAWADELGWALLGLLILVFAGAAIWWFLVHNGTTKRTVPAVTGQPVAAAVDSLQSRGFRVRIFSRPHPEHPGTVFQQIPSAGTRASKGSTVQLLSSAGPSAVTVPNAVGLSEAAGRDRLVSAGFKVTETRVFNQQRAGQVISQNPAAGSKAAKGASVAISVSKGTGVVIVPNVVGQSLGDAETALAKAGLKSNVQLRVPSAQPAGTVVAQNPPGGQAKRGSTVQLNVSTGAGSSSGGTTGTTGATGPTGTG
jgi:eukaryotic-like serine/threonine-protein kinase